MKAEEIQLIQEAVNCNGLQFYYFKDKYALDLLAWHVGEEKKISDIKSGPYARLLERPAVKQILQNCGSSRLHADQLGNYNSEEDWHHFTLGMGTWEGNWKGAGSNWQQTSRPGHQLVLQLNFTQEHNELYYRLMRPRTKGDHAFRWCAHPVAERQITLCWARLDIDLDAGEVLIEEIQNDWLREVKESYLWARKKALAAKEGEESLGWLDSYYNTGFPELESYYQQAVQPYASVWDEAMLNACLWFIRQELGISRIYYHTWETGNLLKQLFGSRPPRSLYSTLPLRFAFRMTDRPPQMLQQCRKLKKVLRRNDLYWYVLEL